MAYGVSTSEPNRASRFPISIIPAIYNCRAATRWDARGSRGNPPATARHDLDLSPSAPRRFRDRQPKGECRYAPPVETRRAHFQTVSSSRARPIAPRASGMEAATGKTMGSAPPIAGSWPAPVRQFERHPAQLPTQLKWTSQVLPARAWRSSWKNHLRC
jgi:hypothetical protein